MRHNGGAVMDVIRKGYADTEAGQIHVRRVDGGGVPVILLHRTPVDSASFETMLRLLAGRRAAVALDTPGFGQSFRPAGLPAATDYAGWLLAAIDALDIDAFHLCGHHTGTHFAAEIALLAPGRTRSLLLNGVTYAEAAERAAIRKQIGRAQPIDEDGRYMMFIWSILKGLFPRFEPELVHTEVIGALVSPAGRDQAFGAILAQDFAAALAKVACPVRIVQAGDDPLAPFLDRVRAAHPEIEIELLGSAGIAAPELQAEPFAESLLAFAQASDSSATQSFARHLHG